MRSRIEDGMPPLEFYTGKGSAVVYNVDERKTLPLVRRDGTAGETDVSVTEFGGGYKISVLAKNLSEDYIVIKPEFRVFHPSSPLLLSKGEFIFPTSKRSFFTFANSYRAFSIHPDDVESELEKYNFTIENVGDDDYLFTVYIDKERFGMEKGEPFRLDIERFEKNAPYDLGCTVAKEALYFSDKLVTRLIHGTFSPECYALIIP